MKLKKYFVFDTKDGSYEEIKTRHTLRTLYKGVKIPWVRIIIGAFLSVFNALILMTQYENYMKLYTGTLEDLTPLWMYLIAYFLQMGIVFLVVIADRAVVEMVTSVSKKLWRKMMHLPARDFETSKPGAMLSRITLDAQYASKPFDAVVALLQAIVTVVTLSAIVPDNIGYAVPVLILSLVGAFALAYWTARVLSRSTLYAQNKKAEQTDHYNEIFANIRFIKASGAEQKTIERSDAFIEKRYNAGLYTALYQGLAQAIGNYSYIAFAFCLIVAVAAIGAGSIKNIEPINSLYAFLFAVSAVVIAFMGFPMYFSEGIGGTKKIVSVFRKEEENVEAGAEAGAAQGDIVLQNGAFAYTDHNAVQNLNVVIPAGQVTAIVGTNGSGKSTMIKLIDRLYPLNDGALSIGSDRAEDISLKSWRRRFAVVSQKTALFSGTLKENICYGIEDASDEAVQNAVRVAGLSELVAEKGLEYDVGVAGSKLSGGEAQRVSIARALVKNPDYLILDEATANLDTRTEAEVTSGIAALMQGRTTIVIAHDFATIEHADNVIVMRDGRIEDSGKRDEMIARNPYMKLMVEG
ncbi:MAG: ABC transporter ATP-binding protein [Clostridia bacterium]|nr:ABC transporter ATP-binding protein [Clostridia bacterium]